MTVEELQIVISAKTEDVRSKFDKLKDWLRGIQPKKPISMNVTTSKAQGNLKKLQAEIDRTQAKIQKLVEKQSTVQSKIDTQASMYSAVPNLAGMGHEETVGTLMDRDPAVQKLNAQMEQLDAETAPLKAHLAETKAKIAEVGSASSPAAAKVEQLGRSMKNTGNRMQSAGDHASYFGRMTSRMLLSMMLYRGVSFIFQSISEGMKDMALGNAQANSTMSQLASSALYLKNSIAASLMPALQALTPVINQVADALAGVFNTIAMLTARIFGHASTVTIAQRANVNYAATLEGTGAKAKQAANEVKELQRTVMGFDELNVLNKPADTKTPKTESGSSGAKPGMPAAGQMFKTVQIPPWIEKVGQITDTIKKMVESNINTITRLLRLAPLVIGAILVFSGANIPLGLGLMAVGAVLMAKQVKEDWGYLTSKTASSLDKVKRALAIAGAVELALGAIFTFSGANVPLGIGLMVGGIATTAATLNWDSMGPQIKKSIGGISFAAAVAMLALGAILTFSGVNVPLGIGLLISGATTMWASATLNWSSMDAQLKSTLTQITAMIGTFLLVLGVMLVCSGGAMPLGIGLIIAGAISLVSSVALNFDTAKDKVKYVLSSILAIASVSSIAIGLLLCLTGGGIPLGIGLIIAGMAGVHAASSISTNPITQWAKSLINGVIGIFESGINWIISMLDKVSFTVPSWVVGIGGKTYGINISQVHIPRLASGGFVTGPTYSLIGEGKDNEAVLPLNDNVYSRIGKGIAENGASSGSNTDRIVGRLDQLEAAIRDMKVELYTTDRKIAESANRGNASIDRRYHTIAQT